MTPLRIYRRRSSAHCTANHQDGYALLLVVFFASILLIGTMSIGLRTLTEGRREKEQEMIWRGKQYTRGIKMYYRKLGRFPNSMDDLVKPKIGNLRFMRQQYTDPMNKDDGSWRFIYVGPAGQLIGSLKPQNQNPLGAPGATGTSTFGQSNGTSAFGSSTSGTGFSQSPAPGSSSSGFGFGTSSQNPGTQPGAPGTGTPGTGATPATGTGTGATSTDSQSIPSGDTPTIVGGNIIGVGSKINKASIMVYEQADNYRLFEFIWNPANDLGVGGMPGASAPAQGLNGQPSAPGQPGAPGQGQSQPGFPANPNPNQNPNPNPQP